MSDTALIWLTGVCGVLLGYLLGAAQWWHLGKKAGEADGVKWARKRLEGVQIRNMEQHAKAKKIINPDA